MCAKWLMEYNKINLKESYLKGNSPQRNYKLIFLELEKF